MRVTKKLLSLILALAMSVSILCASASAADLGVVMPRYPVGTCPNCGNENARYDGIVRNQPLYKTVSPCRYFNGDHPHTFIGDITYWVCPTCGPIEWGDNLRNEKCPYQPN